MDTSAKPFVSIIMPALNEERYISAAIASVVPETDNVQFELLVVDGGSTDGTRAIVEDIMAGDRRVRLLANAKRIQAAGVNMAAQMADPHASYLVRADCHVQYPPGFVEQCVGSLAANQVASVVVPMYSEGATCMQKAIAASQNSRLGNGGSQHRLQGRSGLVEHGHHAAFDRKVFLELGGYDETFSHNEDAEFDMRLVRAGKRIFLDAKALVTYYPRADLISLARQYFSYGKGRARTHLKHRSLPRVRQLLPVFVLLICVASFCLAVVSWVYLLIPAVYLAACVGWGVALALRSRRTCLVLSGIAAIVMHMGWASGFLLELARRPGRVLKLWTRRAQYQ